MRPYKETKLSGSVVLREFSADVDIDELVWHRDQEDRVVTVTESVGWKLQLDNQMPQDMVPGESYFIPAMEWHRVIRGSGKLMIEVDTKAAHPRQYGASQGSKRDKQLDQTKKDLEKAKKLRKDGKAKQAKELEQRAYNRRDRMERQQREKPGFKNKPRSDSKKESIEIEAEDLLREFISELMLLEKKKMSKKTEKALKKKAEEKGYTLGSVKTEYRKGLGAYYSSGSRKGMGPHQWAMARVNSATPSKPWASVKKSKAKKKKK